MKCFPKSCSLKCTKKILEQMTNSFYKVYITDRKSEIGKGFFCYIKYENKKIPIFILNNLEIDKDSFDVIKVKNNNTIKEITLGEIRYKNKSCNMTVFEIEKNKNDGINFFEFDDKLYEEEIQIPYDEKSVYKIQYNNLDDIQVSYGIINNIINNSKFRYFSHINLNSKGSLIFNLSNNKIIGIHNDIYFNHANNGIFLNSIIDDFIIRYTYKRKHNLINNNEIDILIRVEKEDVSKKIFYLNKNEDKSEYKNYDNINILNNLNTYLSINKIKHDFKKYFIPEKEGDYKIKLKFNVNIIDYSYMFAECKNIIDINFISFNIKSTKNIKGMFYKCENLERINLFSFNTKNIINMSYMFYECKKLKILDLSSFNIRQTSDMSFMFYNCKKLEKLDLFSFKNNNIKNLSCMFYNCKSMTNLNLSSFDAKWPIGLIYDLFDYKNYEGLFLSLFNTFNDHSITYNKTKTNKDIQELFGNNFIEIITNIKIYKNFKYILDEIFSLKNLDIKDIKPKSLDKLKKEFEILFNDGNDPTNFYWSYIKYSIDDFKKKLSKEQLNNLNKKVDDVFIFFSDFFKSLIKESK